MFIARPFHSFLTLLLAGLLAVGLASPALFEDYRTAQKAAQQDGLGIWDPSNSLTELPFEYRMRINGESPSKPVGDWFTKKYVDPADYKKVHVNNRIFFWNETDAQAASYTKCPKDSNGNYDPSCLLHASARRDCPANVCVRRWALVVDDHQVELA